jgi:hypothetical protein
VLRCARSSHSGTAAIPRDSVRVGPYVQLMRSPLTGRVKGAKRVGLLVVTRWVIRRACMVGLGERPASGTPVLLKDIETADSFTVAGWERQ